MCVLHMCFQAFRFGMFHRHLSCNSCSTNLLKIKMIAMTMVIIDDEGDDDDER